MLLFNYDFIYITLSVLIPSLLAVALLTVAERKLLAGLQRRHGPSVVGAWGFFQVIADGLKLLLKDKKTTCSWRNKILFILCSLLGFILSFSSWALIQFTSRHLISCVNFGVFWLFILSSLKIYTIFFAGWSSNSKYSLFGGLRAAAQMISYELTLSICTLCVVLLSGSVTFNGIVKAQEAVFFFFPLFPVSAIFFIAIVAETNRPPFDMAEAESELVAGYNVEYPALYFAFLFLSEYCSILIMSALWVIFFWGGWLPVVSYLNFIPEGLWFAIKLCFICFIFILARGIVPRYRYDQLMVLGWKTLFISAFLFFIWLVCLCSALLLYKKKVLLAEKRGSLFSRKILLLKSKARAKRAKISRFRSRIIRFLIANIERELKIKIRNKKELIGEDVD